jgi:hypothetical protein
LSLDSPEPVEGSRPDAQRSVLAVEYESGAVYEYYDVPRSLYEGLLAAQPHPWSVYGEQVKAHRFRQVS